MIDSITTLFDLKETDVEYCTETLKNKVHHFYITLVNRGSRCMNCGTFTKHIKEYKNKDINYAILLNEKSIIHYRARRLVCPKCGKTFWEHNPFSTQYSNVSDKTVNKLLELLKNYNETFSSVANKVFLSTNEVINIFDEHVQLERHQLSRCIALDEFYFSRHAKRKYALMVLSLDKGYVIDLLETREKRRIRSFFYDIPKDEKELVEYVSIDMNEHYRDIIKRCLPHATICADPFHVIKYINNALDDVRLRILRKYSDNHRSDEYYLLKFQKHLLFSDASLDSFKETKRNHHFRYEISDAEKLDMMLAIDSDLETAYLIKEHYMMFDDQLKSPEDQREELDIIIRKCLSSQIPEFISIALTLTNWKEEILNSFVTYEKYIYKNGKREKVTARVTSGPIEGRNKYIKILLHLANGYANFPRFRNRAMYVLNKNDLPSEVRLVNTIKQERPEKKKKRKKKGYTLWFFKGVTLQFFKGFNEIPYDFS